MVPPAVRPVVVGVVAQQAAQAVEEAAGMVVTRAQRVRMVLVAVVAMAMVVVPVVVAGAVRMVVGVPVVGVHPQRVAVGVAVAAGVEVGLVALHEVTTQRKHCQVRSRS